MNPLSNGPNQVRSRRISRFTQPSEESGSLIPGTPSQRFPLAYTFRPCQVYEPTTAHVDAVTADHVPSPQHSFYAGIMSDTSPWTPPLQLYHTSSFSQHALSSSRRAYVSTAHVNAATADHIPSPQHSFYPGIMSNTPPLTPLPQLHHMASFAQYARRASTSHFGTATADHLLAPELAEHRYQPPPGPPHLSSYMVSSPQYSVPLSPGLAYALAPPSHGGTATADYFLAPEPAEHRYQPPPGPPPQSSYAISSPQHAIFGLGPANTLASSGIYPSSPAGPRSLPTPTSQPSAVLSGEQQGEKQEIANKNGLPMFGSNPKSLHRQNKMQEKSFWDIQLHARCAGNPGPFIEQRIYVPHTKSDRLRYVKQAKLEHPIVFRCINPEEDGIPLVDALQSRTGRLVDHDDPAFAKRSPSISLRLELLGYQSWTKQIPALDDRKPRRPITLAKLARKIAKRVQRFIVENEDSPLEMHSDARWKVGGVNGIRFEDLTLVSLHHVSQGSWQPQLRLRRAL